MAYTLFEEAVIECLANQSQDEEYIDACDMRDTEYHPDEDVYEYMFRKANPKSVNDADYCSDTYDDVNDYECQQEY